MLEETEAEEKRLAAEVEVERRRAEVAKAARKTEWQRKRQEKRKQQEGEEGQQKRPRVDRTVNPESNAEESSSRQGNCWYCRVRGMECTRTG